MVSQTGALLLDGNTLSYFGANIPVNLAFAVISEVVLVGGAEYYRSTNKSPLGSVNVFLSKMPVKMLLAESLLSAIILCSEFNFSVLIRALKRASS